jgi:5-methylcytosine-specific restriction endonuclease McrA
VSRAWKGGSTRAWRKVRAYVLERDGYTCRVPDADGRPCGAPATDAGHIVPKGQGGTDTPDNLRGECEPHNSSDGGRLAHAERPVPRGWVW